MSLFKTKYYKATLHIAQEEYLDGNAENGVDPDSYRDLGSGPTFIGYTLQDLLEKIEKSCDLSNAATFENRIEVAEENFERGKHFIALYTFYITVIEEEEIMDTDLKKALEVHNKNR